MQSSELLNTIEQFKTEYYSENPKSFFFKKSQKNDIATKIANEFDYNELLQKTMFIIPNTNKVYIDYPLYKLFAHMDIYSSIVDYVISLMNYCIETYGGFECHINLNSFTISAAERYKFVIELFCKKCLSSNTRYGSKLTKMNIYNAPLMVEKFTSFFSPFIDPLVSDRFMTFNKDESEPLLVGLFA